ncbi:hypothetical protein KAI87_01885, partial [Myxococcota bacterium]|nr:hypothetical protein [Myxococcota bacterium]
SIEHEHNNKEELNYYLVQMKTQDPRWLELARLEGEHPQESDTVLAKMMGLSRDNLYTIRRRRKKYLIYCQKQITRSFID